MMLTNFYYESVNAAMDFFLKYWKLMLVPVM